MTDKVDVTPIDGKTPAEGFSVWGKVKETSRLSARGKGVISAAAIFVVAGILIGVMTSGKKTQKFEEAQIAASSDAPGQTAAPQPGKPESPAPQGAVNGLEVRGEVTGGDKASPAQAGPAKAPTPAEAYAQWREKHRYERLQGQIIAGDAAMTAEVLKSSQGALQRAASSVRGGNEQDDPMAYVASVRRNALAAIPGGMPADPRSSMPATGIPGQSDSMVAQTQHKAFLAGAANPAYLAERVQPRAGEHELIAGSVIPAVMLTAVNSDLPGMLSAQVRQTVYDSHNPNVVVIPQGSRLVGRYSADVGYAQERVLVAWDTLIFPSGASISLKGMLGADGQGQSGFSDKVDTHFFRTWGSAFMISLLGVGVQLSQPQNSGAFNTPSTASQAAGAVANSLNDTGSKVLGKNLGVQPTLQIRPGYAFNVLANRTMILPAYR